MNLKLRFATCFILAGSTHSFGIDTRREWFGKVLTVATFVTLPQMSQALVDVQDDSSSLPLMQSEPGDVSMDVWRKTPLPVDSDIVRNTFVVGEADLKASQERLAYFRETLRSLGDTLNMDDSNSSVE
jgi:hypothetical protein